MSENDGQNRIHELEEVTEDQWKCLLYWSRILRFSNVAEMQLRAKGVANTQSPLEEEAKIGRAVKLLPAYAKLERHGKEWFLTDNYSRYRDANLSVVLEMAGLVSLSGFGEAQRQSVPRTRAIRCVITHADEVTEVHLRCMRCSPTVECRTRISDQKITESVDPNAVLFGAFYGLRQMFEENGCRHFAQETDLVGEEIRRAFAGLIQSHPKETKPEGAVKL